jgi:hypothetical protein
VSVRAFAASVLAIVCGGMSIGCHHRARAQNPGAIATGDTARAYNADSLVGTVSVTGTSFEQRIVLRNGDSVRTLTLSSEDSASLATLGGTEILVRGRAAGESFNVHSFTVRTVDGAPVADGTLGRENGHLVLHTANGSLTLGNPPAALDSLVPSRVWIGGPLATGPNVYGIISRATDAPSAPSPTQPAHPPHTARRR